MHNNKVTTVEQYIRRLSGQEKEPLNVDHNYMKSWSAHPDSNRTKPAKMLFMNILPRYSQKYIVEYDEDIDVTSSDAPPSSPFDTPKSKAVTNDVERSLKLSSFDVDRTEAEDILDNCTFQQQRIYHSVMDVLNADMLAKAVYSGQPHEAIKKRIATEKYANMLRLVFANNFCDYDLIFWIHKVILEKSAFATVVSYVNLLQALRSKIPTIVDKIIKSYSGTMGEEYLSQIVKKQWDPIAPALNQHKPKKLPSNPILLISCAGFEFEKAEEIARFRFWTTNLNALCKTIYVPLGPLSLSDDGHPIKNTVDSMVDAAMTSMKHKINELKNHFPNRPIIVAGWTIGAVIACHVALEMPVDGVICFGFPLTGVNGSRGDLDDPLLNSTKPTLFIVGQNASMCSTDDVEDFRARMSAETGLVVVGGADDCLRISPMKMLDENVTQSIVDRSILDEISDFLQATLMKLPSTSSVVSNTTVKTCPTIIEEASVDSDLEDERKRKRRRPKEYSPELPSRKRYRHTIPKEAPCVPSKPGLSSSSSETSSSGSFKNEKPAPMTPVSRNPEKRGVGRPPGSTSRKKSSIKPFVKPVLKHLVKPISRPVIKPIVRPSYQVDKDGNTIKISAKEGNSLKHMLHADSTLQLIDLIPEKPAEAPIPFALNILPKKNDPVDVEKAFGKDSSFLPRPLTPPEIEEMLLKEAEKAAAEANKTDMQPIQQIVDLGKISISEPEHLKVQSIDTVILQSPTNPISEKSILPLAEQMPISPVGSKALPASIIKPVLNLNSDVKKRISVSVSSPSLKTVFQQGKVLNSNPATQIKNMSGVKFIGKPISQANATNVSKATITVPSNSATILVNGSTLKTQSGRVLKLLSKGPIALKTKDPSTVPSIVSGSASSGISRSVSPIISSPSGSRSTETQVCNLSLLSDVAGMTEPMKDTRKPEPSSSSATLVKLAVPDKQNLKRIQVFRTLQTRPIASASTRVDTPEEMVEKQLAIQALSKSISGESSTQPPPKESGYSICFAKPDGSIFSRTVPKISNTTYLRQSLLPSARGKPRYVAPRMNFVKK